MNSGKIIAIVAVVLVIAAGAAGIIILSKDDDSSGTVTDMRGRLVDVPDEINSIICFSSCSLELVSFFDMVNNVKYVDQNENFTTGDRTHSYVMSNKLGDLPKLDQNDHEAVAVTNADLIIMSTIEVERLNEYQTKYRIPVFAINADLEFGDEYYKQLELLGKIFNEEARATELVDGIQKLISDITSVVPASDGTTAYASGMNFFGSGTIPFLKTSGDYLPFIYSNIENTFNTNPDPPGKQPYVTDLETVLEKAPDYIFIDGVGLTSSINYIKDNKALFIGKNVGAVVDGNIYSTLVYKAWGTNWQNVLINVYYVAKVFHEDLFTWSFEDKADEILQLFYPGTTVTYSQLANASSGGECRQITL
jgi:ABC-type Fe3+-hydroxamate transport system, periplasmic component